MYLAATARPCHQADLTALAFSKLLQNAEQTAIRRAGFYVLDARR